MKKLAQQQQLKEGQRVFTLELDYKTLIEHAKPLYYGESIYGYHRKTSVLQIKKLANKIKKRNVFVLPTPLILGLSTNEMMACLTNIDFQVNIEDDYFLFDSDALVEGFRFIVGYPVIKAIGLLLSDKELDSDLRNSLEHYTFPVSLVVSSHLKRNLELDILKKTLSYEESDLVYLAKYNYDLIDPEFDLESSIKEQLKVRVMYYLADNDLALTNSCWKNGIKLDAEVRDGLISKRAFSESIDSIIDEFLVINKTTVFNLNKYFSKHYLTVDELQKNLDDYAKELVSTLLIPAWEIIYKQWEKAFDRKRVIKDDLIIETFVNPDYYIQKTQCVKALNGLLAESYKEYHNEVKALEAFETIIKSSRLTSTDWHYKGHMRGLNSDAGVRIIKSMLTSK